MGSLLLQLHAGLQHVATILQHFIANALAHFFYQFRVPGAGKRCSHRKTRTEISVGVVLAARIDSHAGRTIGQHTRWDTLSRNGLRHACRSWHLPRVSTQHAVGFL